MPLAFDRAWREYDVCAHCDEPIVRVVDGAWSHVLDARSDWDHDPEPELEPMTEAQAELQLHMAPRNPLIDAGDGLHWDPTAGDFVEVVELREDGLL